MDNALELLIEKIEQFVPMDEEATGQFQEPAKNMMEQTGKSEQRESMSKIYR